MSSIGGRRTTRPWNRYVGSVMKHMGQTSGDAYILYSLYTRILLSLKRHPQTEVETVVEQWT